MGTLVLILWITRVKQTCATSCVYNSRPSIRPLNPAVPGGESQDQRAKTREGDFVCHLAATCNTACLWWSTVSVKVFALCGHVKWSICGIISGFAGQLLLVLCGDQSAASMNASLHVST